MAKIELFQSLWTRWMAKGFGAIPVRRDTVDRDALEKAKNLLSSNNVIGLFPEGTRSESAQLLRGMNGAALLAIYSGAPILPIGITGTEKLDTIYFPLVHPHVTVNIGKPFSLEKSFSNHRKERLKEVTDIIMRRIAELLPPSYRGIYAEGNGSSANTQ